MCNSTLEFLSVCMCGVCMPAQLCICAHPCMNVCAYLCMHMWRPEGNIGCLYLSYGIFWKRVSHWTWVRLDWIEKRPLVFPSLLLLMLLWFQWASPMAKYDVRAKIQAQVFVPSSYSSVPGLLLLWVTNGTVLGPPFCCLSCNPQLPR